MAHAGPTRKASRYHRLDDIPTNTFTPRTYQIQLLDAALKKNTLLCLGCSQSKVFLALMVAKELATSTRTSVRCDHRKVTFYLTDSDEEVDSLCQTLPHHTDLQVGRCPNHLKDGTSQIKDCTGRTHSLSPDRAHLKEWHNLLESSNILVCCGSVFLSAVQKGYVQLKNVNLLIFDECHRSADVERHPYAEIVAHVRACPTDNQPHILGVTASLAGTECSDPHKLQETIASMEKTMHAYAETSMLILSERFGCRPKESVIYCNDLEITDEQVNLRALLEDLLENNYYFFCNCNVVVNSEVDNRDPADTPMHVLSQCLNVLNILGPWCASSISEYFVMQLEKIVKCEKNEIHKRFLRCVITTLRALIRHFEKNFHPDYNVDELLEFTTPKVWELVKVLRNYKPELDFMIISNNESYNDVDDDFSDISDDDDDDDSMSDTEDEEDGGRRSSKLSSKPVHIAVKCTVDGGHERVLTFTEEDEKNLCGIVFVENKYIAFALNKLIEEICSWDENLCFVKSCYITGQGLRGASGKQKLTRTYKRQEEALRKFRTQEFNLVIATQELEEGIDIPKCNLIVRFDSPKDYRSYTLSKGRARARDASYVILLDKQNCEQFESSLKVFKGIEQVLLGERNQKQAKSANVDGDDLSDEENECEEDIEEEDLLPSYYTIPGSPTSPQVSMQDAIALINRYCARLPSDAFTHLTPQCRLKKLTGDPTKYVACLRLPINSPIKEELEGPAMRTKKLAKMAVALKMCEILHCQGELDENLVPVGKEMFLYEEEEEWADEEDLTGQARPGTTKRKQYYIKKVAGALIQSLPKPEKPCYLYLINLQLTGPITDEQNTRGRIIYAPEDTEQTLGILLAKPLPQIPHFPVYTRSGEVTVSIDLLQSSVTFSKDEISRLLKFHHFVFSGVLHLEKDPMEFDPESADYGCVILPLNGKEHLDIEWSFVDKVIQFMDLKKRGGVNRKNPEEPFEFYVDDFKDAVVMPSYRNIDQPQHFYVAEILHDLNPLSPFPSPELYKTFQDYYTTKYGLMITNTKQPLLDVDHTSARLNLLTPRYMNQKGVALPTSSAETKRARRENLQQKQILVPELCDIHVFPASLWRKTVCLPAVLYRANNLLLAEELRGKISRETAIGVEMLPQGFRFPQLDFGFETSPEKLKDVESSITSKRPDQSPSGVKGCRCGVADSEQDLGPSCGSLNAKSESPCVNKKCAGLDLKCKAGESGWEIPEAEEESTLWHDDKSIHGKIDSTSSSDSDSGIASSSSDTNIGIPGSTESRGSPEMLTNSSAASTPASCPDTGKSSGRTTMEAPEMMTTRGASIPASCPDTGKHSGRTSMEPPDMLTSSSAASTPASCPDTGKHADRTTTEAPEMLTSSSAASAPVSCSETGKHSGRATMEESEILTMRGASISASCPDMGKNSGRTTTGTPKQTEVTIKETKCLSLNSFSLCSGLEDLCNSTEGSTIPLNNIGNPHNQCNFIYNNSETAVSNYCVNGQPEDSSSSTTNSTVIVFDHTHAASSSSSSTTTSNTAPVIDSSTSSASDNKDNPEANQTSATGSITQTAEATANICINDTSFKLPQVGDLAVSEADAAFSKPGPTSFLPESSSSSSSQTATSLSKSPPVTPYLLSDPSQTFQIGAKSRECQNIKCSSVSNKHASPDKITTYSNISIHLLTISSHPAASNHVLCLQEAADRTKSVVGHHATQGCELKENFSDDKPALLTETLPKEAACGTKICDTSAAVPTSHQINITPLVDHQSVHLESAQTNLASIGSLKQDKPTLMDLQPTDTTNKAIHFTAEAQPLHHPSHITNKASHSSANAQPLHHPSHTTEKKAQSAADAHPLTNGLVMDEMISGETYQKFAKSKSISQTTGQKCTPTADSMYTLSPSSASKKTDESSIIMNTLGQELSSLAIDLIIPQPDSSDAFHSSNQVWGTSNNESKMHPKMSSWGSSMEENSRGSNESQQSDADISSKEKEDNMYKNQCKNDSSSDADVIKFSFATDKFENNEVKEDFTVGEWVTESKKKRGQAENMKRSKGGYSSQENVRFTSASASSRCKENLSNLQSSNSDHGTCARITESQISDTNGHEGISLFTSTEIPSIPSPHQPLKTTDSAATNPFYSPQAPSSYPQPSSSDPEQHVSLDADRDLRSFVGPSPCLIMQALTMSNANDFFSLERLETIGDSFLKYAITVYLYCSYPGIHEGKLSYLRSKQVSNYNLYRLGRRKCLAECMVSTKFEPYENWLPPGFVINEDRRRGPVPKVVIVTPGSKATSNARNFFLDESGDAAKRDEAIQFKKELEWIQQSQEADQLDDLEEPAQTNMTPYSLQRHHGLPDKSVADCVEALIGCYLTTCGRKAALMFMSWLGLKVLPKKKDVDDGGRGAEVSVERPSVWKVSEQEFDELRCPPSPMFSPTPENMAQLEHLLEGFDTLEEKINYKFRDRSYLLQAFTHASYHYNTITDCYQRVEFLGDAILDYVITRHLYEDSKKYSPGILTDLRSALVNNNIFAVLAVKWGFHKYFKAISPSLFQVIDKFAKRQKESNQDDIDIDEEYQELSIEDTEPEETNDDDDDEEEVEMEIPKALGDIFESVAGAIYLDSGMSLDTVWRVYYRMMKPHIDKYLKSIPKSPVRELLETEPETAKFERPERTVNGKVRVTVNVVGKGVFSGIGRNYRIAKSAAAKKALRSIRTMNQNLMG